MISLTNIVLRISDNKTIFQKFTVHLIKLSRSAVIRHSRFLVFFLGLKICIAVSFTFAFIISWLCNESLCENDPT